MAHVGAFIGLQSITGILMDSDGSGTVILGAGALEAPSSAISALAAGALKSGALEAGCFLTGGMAVVGDTP